jgi:major vault protein
MAMDTRETQARDTTLPPDTYLYMQNIGKGGIITVFRGPFVITQSGQDVPVKYDPINRKFQKANSLEDAVMQYQRANEGDYIVLENPAESGKFPSEAQQQAAPLRKGRKVVIPGPWSEAMWPGQSGVVIEGHRLRTNQYVVVSIYNAEEAERNWDTGTVAKAQDITSTSTETDPEKLRQAKEAAEKAKAEQPRGLPRPESFAVGTRIVIKGSDVSFFIPCTGVEVLKDENNKFVREAVTLEQMEYCCLVGETGKKEYPHGPAVVFPLPTQTFESDSKGRKKFRPVELNTINGIHLKVTAAFKGPDIENDVTQERAYKEGEELFVTGKTLQIYYPREELSVIEYGAGNKKHFSTAIPKGEGRYVITRQSGVIRTICGPNMFLADPRTDIPVRRVLSEDECRLYYPGNEEAVAYNKELLAAMQDSPSGRSGMVSEGDYRKRQMKSAGGSHRNFAGANPQASYLAGGAQALESMQDDMADAGDEGGATETIRRGTKFTPPRAITLNTKYDGVPKIEVWPGYAILVVGAEGQRQVVQGPNVILLDYDQKLGFMELSTGKPKNTDKLYKTAYLQTTNNQVGDIITFESKDHVKGTVKISLRVNFEAANDDDKLKWFSVSNYVKFLTDHVRSIIAGMAKRNTIAGIKADYINLVRDAILGMKGSADGTSEPLKGRPGLAFDSNMMRVVDVDVLDLTLNDPNVAKMLDDAQLGVVRANIEVDNARKALETTRAKEEIVQQTEQVKADTAKFKNSLQKELYKDELNLLVDQIVLELQRLANDRQKTEKLEEKADFIHEKKLARDKADAEQMHEIETSALAIEKDRTASLTDAAVKRFEAAKDGLHETLMALTRDDLAAKLAQGCTIERWLSGDNASSAIGNLLSIAPTLKAFFDKAGGMDGKPINRLKEAEVPASPR